jgi:short-subunit dehydrogenase
LAQLALVTGASSGIGAAYAKRLGELGFDLIVVGRRLERLEELADSLSAVEVQILVADLATDAGIDEVATVCSARPLSMLVNNAGVAHYMAMAELPADKARELIHVKTVAPTMLIRAALPGMLERGAGTIVNVAGMLAFAGSAPLGAGAGRATYTGTLALLVAMTQSLNQELADTPVRVQVLCPGIVATEFHERQGMDLSAVPRMAAAGVVLASLRGLELGEVLCAPGVEDTSLLDQVTTADLAAFGGQSTQLAQRYLTR